MTVASWERNPCHGNNICVDKLMSKLDDYGGCHSGTDHTGHFRHHPLASLVVIVWKLVGQRLFLNIIPNNFLARTRRIVWCELIDPPPFVISKPHGRQTIVCEMFICYCLWILQLASLCWLPLGLLTLYLKLRFIFDLYLSTIWRISFTWFSPQLMCLTCLSNECGWTLHNLRLNTTRPCEWGPTHRKVGNKPHFAPRGVLNSAGPTGSNSRRIAWHWIFV